MKFYSTNDKDNICSFREALIEGLAPDNGLYFPSEIPQLSSEYFKNISGFLLPEIGFEVMHPFLKEEMSSADLMSIVEDAFDFEIPLVKVSDEVLCLELYHGPTCAFKDVGARMMSRCLSHFSHDKVTVLVATSGDTGSAVANGFLDVEGVEVVLLYPSGKISKIQEQQLTTLGKNITALEVDGTFDECQAMVKAAFLDEDLKGKMNLTSANSINIARWIPQSIYFHHAYAQLGDYSKPIMISVPSGNFGNLTSGVLAMNMGLPIDSFIAATNANNIVPEYLQSGEYMPRPSVETISNAMDVGAPSNFVRLLELFDHDFEKVRDSVTGYSMSDDETRKTMADCFSQTDYILDPHGAVAYQALLEDNDKGLYTGIFLETAHPSKFTDVVEDVLNIDLILPERLKECMNKEKKSIKIDGTSEALKAFLM